MSSRELSPHEIIRSGMCIGCGSCVSQSAPETARMGWDQYGQYKPAAKPKWLQHRSQHFTRTCPFSPDAADEDTLAAQLFPAVNEHSPTLGHVQFNYVGHVAENGFRDRASSGGMVSWVLAELLRQGLVDGVAHVHAVADPQAEGKFFEYRISRTAEEIYAGAKSRYFPVELSAVLRTIRATPGRYAIVAVPCFIKAINLLRREDPVIRERVVYTLGLFCGHMKSARLVQSFAWQMGVELSDVRKVEYRIKDISRPASTYTAELTLADGSVVKRDWFNMADGDWGAGFFQNSACNWCDDVVAETADISFGDAWVEPYSSDGRGTNVVITRSPEMTRLVQAGIAEGRLNLETVDNDFIVQTQAAGFRQRREGLAYRLTWGKRGIRPRKRVAPDAKSPTLRRKLIYRSRAFITAWSHRMSWLADHFGKPAIYVKWAWTSLSAYHGFAYSRGRLGKLLERFHVQ